MEKAVRCPFEPFVNLVDALVINSAHRKACRKGVVSETQVSPLIVNKQRHQEEVQHCNATGHFEAYSQTQATGPKSCCRLSSVVSESVPIRRVRYYSGVADHALAARSIPCRSAQELHKVPTLRIPRLACSAPACATVIDTDIMVPLRMWRRTGTPLSLEPLQAAAQSARNPHAKRGAL